MGKIGLEKLTRLASLWGIENGYYTIKGQWIDAPLETMQRILVSMGEDVSDETKIEQSIREREKELSFPILPVMVTRERTVRFPRGEGWTSVELQMISEQDEMFFFHWSSDETIEITLPPELSWGYYRLLFSIQIFGEPLRRESFLIFTPGQCFLPPEQKIWGMQLPLYALDTPGNQGIGDLGDLKMIQEMVRKNQGGFVGILPIHLLENRLPRGISPYFPLTRMLWNPIYLSLEEVFRFHGFSDDGSDLMEWCSTIDDWKKDPWIDYEKVWDFKKNFLRKIFHHFIDHESVLPSPRWNSFQTYFREEGEDLLASSVFLFLGDLNPGNENPPSLDSSVIHNIYHTHHREVLFYAYLQWLMDSFLKLLWDGGGILGFDLPVGTSPSGIECWLHRDVFTLSQRVGVPPDDFSPVGQNWGFSPVNPWKEREKHYTHFIQLLQKNLKYARFLRIDHLMGLCRLFWIPEGMNASQGTYVHNFFEDLLAILAVESTRARTTIIGEDLGTVPPEVREAMARYRILSTRVFYFENDSSGLPRSSDHYPRESMVTLSTHDMPPLRAFMEGKDIVLRKELSIYDASFANAQWEERKKYLHLVLSLLQREGLLSPLFFREENPPDSSVLFNALLRFLLSTPARLCVVNLDDLFGNNIQPNLPGTTTEYPNWRHRDKVNPKDLEEKIRYIGQLFEKQADISLNE